MSEQAEKANFDPAASMVQFYDAMAQAWARAMNNLVASEGFADAVAEQMQANLETMGLMRKHVSELMDQYLQQMSLPSHQEVLGLAERLTRLEMRLDDMDAKLDEALDCLRALRKPEKGKRVNARPKA